jgi:hydrogenase maturation protein HypF
LYCQTQAMPTLAEEPGTLRAASIKLCGRVQGIGLRPAVVRFASQLGLAGRIGNTCQGVQIVVEGSESAVARFLAGMKEKLPPAARIQELHTQDVIPEGISGFSIARAAEVGPLSACVPPDQVVCPACLAEVDSADDRRAGYAFTSCVDCGPRYSIMGAMPYERAQTSMAAYELCAPCQTEYESSTDRRFHAQTTACPACGPRLWCRDRSGRLAGAGSAAIAAAAATIRRGKIVALQGVGGYQLLVDATSPAAVERLRERKRRHGKPLAVMVASLDEAKRLAWFDETEQALLSSPAGPIVVARARDDSPLAGAVRPGLDTVGLMLPSTPLHWLLLRECCRPLVATSGNAEGEPLAYRHEEALRQLRGAADLWLEHDRPIRRPIDDSVARVIAGQAATIRLARGYAPLPLELNCPYPLFALGGHQKAAIALANGAQAVLGPHVGDLDTLCSRERLLEQIAALADLYGVRLEAPEARFVVDEHPDYFTTQWAAAQAGVVDSVQHHHAHIAAGMLEHGWLDREVLGVAFDGTGYGSDGTIWGGEFLLATATGFTRVAHLRPFRLPGGERAVREPWRVAVALVEQAVGREVAARLVFPTDQGGMGRCDCGELLRIAHSDRFSPVTTSAGRLFDGVAALALHVSHCQFEGQAAMMLEAACSLDESGSYTIATGDEQSGRHTPCAAAADGTRSVPATLDWRPMIAAVLRDRAAGVAPGVIAMRFHRGLAHAVAGICRQYRPLPVVLGGGVFQNRVLVELLAEELADAGQPLGLPGVIPVNDGGLAAGQLVVACSRRRSTRA